MCPAHLLMISHSIRMYQRPGPTLLPVVVAGPLPVAPFGNSFGLPMVNRTYKPDSLMIDTTSPCVIPAISIRLTATIRSPTFSSLQRSAGLPGINLPVNDF